MANFARTVLVIAAACVTLLAPGCGRQQSEEELAQLDNALVGSDADPALTSALNDQILVDPALTQQSNRLAVRPPETPIQAQYPPPDAPAGVSPTKASAVAAAEELRRANASLCGGAEFDTNPAWARRLPAAFPLYPGARLNEAAANNANGCTLRVVTFSSGDDYNRLLDHYHTLAVRGGFSSEHQVRGEDHILAGANERTGGAFYLIATPVRGGTEASLIVNNGR